MKWVKIKELRLLAHEYSTIMPLSFESFDKIQRFIDAVLAADKIDLHTSDIDEQRIMKERVDAQRELIGD